MTEDSTSKKGSFGQNFDPESLHRAYILLVYYRDGTLFPKQIAKRLKQKRQIIEYWTNKLLDQDLIYCTNPKSNKFKQYKLTPAGQTFLDTNESTVTKKGRVMVENARFKCYIRNQESFLPFIQFPEYEFKMKTDELRNNVVYHGKIGGVNVRIIHGARKIKNVTLEMTSPEFFGKTGHEANYVMYDSMLRFQSYLEDKWNLHLTPIKLDSEHVEYTWESPYAKEMMKRTRGNPVSTTGFRINQSPPSLKPKEEFHDYTELDRHLMLPDVVDQLRKEIDLIKQGSGAMNQRMDEFNNAVMSLAESTRSMAESSREMKTEMTNLTLKLTEVVTAIQGKNIVEQGKTEQKEILPPDPPKGLYS